MKPTIDTTNASEDEVHIWTAFASDVGLHPGVFPERLATPLGNRQPFVFARYERGPCGEKVAARYQQGNGCLTLRLFND
jgi:hypothetical protein